MPGTELVRRTDAIVWELRRFCISGKRVALSLTDEAGRRAEGHVTTVSPTGGTVTISGVMIPAEHILAVHRPVILGEDSNWVAGRWHFDPHDDGALAGQLRIPGIES
jgi:hypothetical protein